MSLGKENDRKEWRSLGHIYRGSFYIEYHLSYVWDEMVRARTFYNPRGIFSSKYLKRMTRAENRPQEGDLPDPGRHPAARD